MDQSLLSQLKDIHLPSMPGIWPLAPGWHGLTVILLALLLFFGWQRYRHYRVNRYRREALKELERLAIQQMSAAETAAELSLLLKRVARAAFPQQPIGNLVGEAWLQFLDETGQTQEFTQGAGRFLMTAPYQLNVECDISALVIICGEWIKKH